MAITVSERAAAEIKKAAEKREKTPKGLRVGIRAGGCTGFSYLFEWSDGEPRPEDNIIALEGTVPVIVDPKSWIYLDGSILDYAATMMHRGFKFTNPNVKSTCGCGESVQF